MTNVVNVTSISKVENVTKLEELMIIENYISEKTGFKTAVRRTVPDEDGIEWYQVHISVDKGRNWKYIDLHVQPKEKLYKDLMYQLVNNTEEFDHYENGMNGLILKTVLQESHLYMDGYEIAYGELIWEDFESDGGEYEVLCKVEDVISIKIKTTKDGEIDKLTIKTKDKRIVIDYDGHMIEDLD